MQMGAANQGYGMQPLAAASTCLPFAGKIEAFLRCLEINWKTNCFVM
jgi:hypothetical protein